MELLPRRSSYKKRACEQILVGWVAGTICLLGWLGSAAAADSTQKSAGTETITNGFGMTLVEIDAGSFLMGSPPAEVGRQVDETQHQVIITRRFFISTTLVTQSQWKTIMGNNPSNFVGNERPVELVKWSEAVSFCAELSKREGRHYRLPTEAEWEFACRAGTQHKYFFGDDASQLGKYAWYLSNSNFQTHAVAKRISNAWGLYDMLGNVEEWCSDWYADYPTSAVTDPKGPDVGKEHVLRGGAWNSVASLCRCAYRDHGPPDVGYNSAGFRVVLDP